MVITSAKPLNIFGFLMFGLTRIICNLVARFYTYGLYNMLPWKTDYVKLLEDKEQTISNLENNLLTIQDPLKGDKILQEIKEDKALTQMALENLQPLTKSFKDEVLPVIANEHAKNLASGDTLEVLNQLNKNATNLIDNNLETVEQIKETVTIISPTGTWSSCWSCWALTALLELIVADSWSLVGVTGFLSIVLLACLIYRGYTTDILKNDTNELLANQIANNENLKKIMADYDSELAKLKKEIEISKTTGSPTNTNPLKNLDNDWETKAVEFNSLDEATKVKLIRAAAELAEIIGKK